MNRNLILAVALAAFAWPLAAVAQSDNSLGAPSSAAGGVRTEPLVPPATSLPSPAGPQGPGSSPSSTSSSIHDLTPGTGKFEAPNNAPCIGSTGFGSTQSQPGHRC